MSDIEAAVRGIVLEIKREALARSESSLNIFRNSALQILSRESQGRVYKRGVASVAGATPNPQSGNLRRNWSGQKLVTGDLRITLRIKSRMHYADYLEFGTRKMAARPYRNRIRNDAIPKIKALFDTI